MTLVAINKEQVNEILSKIEFSGEIKFSEELKNHTSFRIGGPADCFLIPATREELIETIRRLREEKIGYYLLGRGTNLLVSDGGVRGVVIKLGRALTKFYFDRNLLRAEAGCRLDDLSRSAQKQGLSGMEFTCGIPGTVGGAVLMNAGGGGKEMADIILGVKVLTPEGEITTLPASECSFSYRKSRFARSGTLILEAEFGLNPASPASIRHKMKENLRRRKEKFPGPVGSAGCIFKNPAGDSAGRLIEAAGLKGCRIGRARVSDKHANFIINPGGARQAEVAGLIELIRKKVRQKFGVGLELEIEEW